MAALVAALLQTHRANHQHQLKAALVTLHLLVLLKAITEVMDLLRQLPMPLLVVVAVLEVQVLMQHLIIRVDMAVLEAMALLHL
jgi:hypothetical protein